MPTVTRSLAASLATFAVAFPALASEFGRDGFSGNPGTNGGAICAACHAPGASTPSLTILGPATVDASSTNTYTATLVGGPGVTGGLNVSATGALGTLLSVDADLAPIGDEISHTQPKPFSGGTVSFEFQWTAPSWSGDVTLYAAGNSTNGQLDLLGDGIASSQLIVSVVNGGPPPPPDPPPPPTFVTLEPFASGLDQPVVIENVGDDRLFVVEQPGRIRVVESDGSVLGTPFLDIEARVDSAGNEQGLLGLAFHPSYGTNGYFYVDYTIDLPSGLDRTRISRFSVSSDPNVADPLSEHVLLEFEQLYSNHNGGDIHFGPDGYLYIAAGDGGSGGDPQNQAQDPNALLGKLLRIDVDGGGGAADCGLVGDYGVPLDNAFSDGAGGAGCDEVWSLGLRNPWRFAFDRSTDDLWIADVGQNLFEEIDFVPSGTSSGLNFGWRCYEGFAPYDSSGCGVGYLEPVLVTTHADGNCSITGGRVYRGSRSPSLAGRYVFTDFCNSTIRTLTRDGSSFVVDDVLPAGAISQAVTFGEDVDGELYVASQTGVIFHVRGPASVAVPALPPWGLVTLTVALLSLGLLTARATRNR